jgi:hypothetical protein
MSEWDGQMKMEEKMVAVVVCIGGLSSVYGPNNDLDSSAITIYQSAGLK